MGHLGETGLGLLGKAGKDHRDVISGMPVAGAGDDDSVAMNFRTSERRLKCDRHFRPGSKRGGTAEFDAVFVQNNCVW